MQGLIYNKCYVHLTIGGIFTMSNDNTAKQIKHINISIPAGMHTEAKINATRQGLTLGDYVRKALETQLKKDSDN